MLKHAHNEPSAEPTLVHPRYHPSTRRLLVAGVSGGPLFYGLVVAQLFWRPGFNVVRHPLSLLSLGDGGWVQRAAFVIAGLLVIAGAAGLRRPLLARFGRAWGAALIGIFGAGTSLAGVFPPDAAFGFPPGTPAGAPATMTTHSMLHGICFDSAFLCVIIATFIFGAAYRRVGRGFATVSFCCGIALPVLIVAGMAAPAVMGAFFFVAGAIAFGWTSALCLDAMRA